MMRNGFIPAQRLAQGVHFAAVCPEPGYKGSAYRLAPHRHWCVALWRMPAPVTLRAATPESASESTSALATALRRKRAELTFCRGAAAREMSVPHRTLRA